MKANEAIRKIMAIDGVGTKGLADKLGKSMRLVSDRLRQDNISVKTLDEMIRVMGYKIVLVPHSTRTGENTFEIE